MTRFQRDDSGVEAFHGETIGSVRSYIADAQTWIVREVVDPITLKRVLIFTSGGIGRRVRTYPANWRELSAEDLHAVSWST